MTYLAVALILAALFVDDSNIAVIAIAVGVYVLL